MYKIRFTGRFRKDYNIICKRGYDLNLLKAVIRKLTINGQVPEKFCSHKLSGKYKDSWECHIKPDWLLIWDINEEESEIWLVRTGTHYEPQIIHEFHELTQILMIVFFRVIGVIRGQNQIFIKTDRSSQFPWIAFLLTRQA